MSKYLKKEQNEVGQPIGFIVHDWEPPCFPSHEPMQGIHCRLEPIDPSRHAESLFSANKLDIENTIWTYLPYGPFDDQDEYTDWLIKISSETDPQFYAIVDLDREQAVGLASYLRIAPNSGSIEVGHLCYSPLLQRSIAATEAMYLMMKRAFDLGYRRYEWKCNSLNEASCKAAKRLGFSFEGVFKQAAVIKGRNRDTTWFSVTDRDWPELKKAFTKWLSPLNFNHKGIQIDPLSELTSVAIGNS
jgi:RimJ/RimL family protein N-acetyltransferase